MRTQNLGGQVHGVHGKRVVVDEKRRVMYRVGRRTGVSIVIAVLAALALAAGAGALENQTMEVHLTQSRDSGVSGTATLEDVEGGVRVTLEVQGLPEPGVKHINHIHAGGTCADDRAGRTAPVTIPLKTIVAQEDGTGSATTTIKDVSVAQLFGEDKERFILLHAKAEKGGGVPPGISCADLTPLADTGGTAPAALLLAGAILALGTAAGLFVLRGSGA
jgi:Cu/Zn superoxide dismutase